MERRQGVNRYSVVQSMMGSRVSQVWERVRVTDPNGGEYETFRLVPPEEVQRRSAGDPGMTPAELELYADATEMLGEGLATEIENGLESAGLPRGLLAATGSDPNATLDPRVMMGGWSPFLRGAAAGQNEANLQQDAADEGEAMAVFARAAELVGTEAVDGRSAFHLRAEGLDRTEEVDGQRFTLDAFSLWVDAEMYVPLRMKMDGVATGDGESRPISIERVEADYRQVPGSNMYESYRQTVRIGGMMTPAQEAEMREAGEQMAELERQMAAMPPEQRAMMERMMGGQLETMRRMMSGGGMEIETVIEEIRVNSDPLRD